MPKKNRQTTVGYKMDIVPKLSVHVKRFRLLLPLCLPSLTEKYAPSLPTVVSDFPVAQNNRRQQYLILFRGIYEMAQG